MPGPPGPPIVIAAADPPLEVNQDAVAVIEDEQKMDEDVPAAEQPGSPRKANVVNRMDPKVWLVPYVSISSDEEEDDSDEEGKFLFAFNIPLLKKVSISVMSDADTVILVNGSNGNDEEDNDEDGNEESLAEASLPVENIIKEARSLSVSAPDVPVVTID